MEEQYEELLENQEMTLQRMDEETRLLFHELEVDETDLLRLLRDKTRFDDEEWSTMQRHREALEKAIDTRIHAAKKSKKTAQAKASEIQGHWIFVR